MSEKEQISKEPKIIKNPLENQEKVDFEALEFINFSFNNKFLSKVRSVYLSLFEIKHKFKKAIPKFTNNISKITGYSEYIIRDILGMFKAIGLITTKRQNNPHKRGKAGTFLTINQFKIENIENIYYFLLNKENYIYILKYINVFPFYLLFINLIKYNNNYFNKQKLNKYDNKKYLCNKYCFLCLKENNISNDFPMNLTQTAFNEAKKGELLPAPSSQLEDILECWNSKQNLTSHRKNSKTTKNAFVRISKVLSKNKYEVADIKRAIDNYYTALYSKRGMLKPEIPGHKVSLEEFFGFSGYTRSRAKKQRVTLPKVSWFVEFANSPREYFDELEEINEGLTRRLKKLYIDNVMDSLSVSFNAKQERQFVLASNKLLKFKKQHRRKMRWGIADEELAEDLIKSLIDSFGKKSVSVGNLCSNYTFNTVLLKYLNEQGAFKQDNVI